MAATIHLDRPHAHFTNLDFITGRVTLRLDSDTSISSINVKLEGVSRTRLVGPRHPGGDVFDKRKTEVEIHKILYKVLTVFPTPDVATHSSNAAVFTLAAGVYEYPFGFKFPLNNSCSRHNSMLPNLNIAGLVLESAYDSNIHVKKTLPPSLSDFQGEAEIQYYVKATIARPQFYKENIRTFAEFNFLPIEPPRPNNLEQETYARREQQFSTSRTQRRGLFNQRTISESFTSSDLPPRFSVEAKLPNPPILTCNEPIPLRILVKKLSESPDAVFVQLLHIELIAHTHIIAHDLSRPASSSWVLSSLSNMNTPLWEEGDPIGEEYGIDSAIWNRRPLPNTVAPSFTTCNISRNYKLEVRVGLSRGTREAIKPELIFLPLSLAVSVYSGVPPPQALLDAMAASISPASRPTNDDHLLDQSGDSSPTLPPRPGGPIAAHDIMQTYNNHDDAPPSYEDAMAEGIGPVDGPRREYNPPNASGAVRNPSAVTNTKSLPNTGRSDESLYIHTGMLNGSTESLDMLPASPASHLGSLPESPITGEARPSFKPPLFQEAPPEYHELPQPQESNQSSRQGSATQSTRRINLGVPNRKPVPGSTKDRFSLQQ